MAPLEIRDPSDARRFLAQGLWLQRAARPTAATVAPALRWSAELAASGEPIPPVGFIADAGQIALDGVRNPSPGRPYPEVPGWPAGLVRAYEDLVLGRLDADGSMARASAALAHYRGRDRARGLAFLVDAVRCRAGFPGVLLNPASIKAAQEVPAGELLSEGWDTLARDGPMPVLVDLYERLVAAVREMPEALGPEDVFELEGRTALMPFADRVAIRQVVRAASDLDAAAAVERPRTAGGRHDVATEVLDDDTYPVGGYSSISTRGSIESLLHSQLVYMERDERPDLFDIKYVRDELLYYARDDNRFFRRRRGFQVVLDPGLALARVKDAGLPYQRIILTLAVLVAAVKRVESWLGDESLAFAFLTLRDGEADPLAPERALLEMALRESIAGGTASVEAVPECELSARTAAMSRGSRCLRLLVAPECRRLDPCGFPAATLRVGDGGPALLGDLVVDDDDPAEAMDGWAAVLRQLLCFWMSGGEA